MKATRQVIVTLAVIVGCGETPASDDEPQARMEEEQATDSGPGEDGFGNSEMPTRGGPVAEVDLDAPLDLSIVGDWLLCLNGDCVERYYMTGARFREDGTFAELEPRLKPDMGPPICVEVTEPTRNRYSFDGVHLAVEGWAPYDVVLNGDMLMRTNLRDDYVTHMVRVATEEAPGCP